MRRALAASCGLHAATLALLLAAGLLARPAPRRLPYAEVALVLQPSPAVGNGGALAHRSAAAAPAAAAASPAAGVPDAAGPPPSPAGAGSAAHAAPDAAPGAGDAGTGRVTGEHVIPARPEGARNAPPPYPADAVRRGEQGLVSLLIHVAPDGRAAAVDVVASSGFADLDAAAQATVRAWHYRPALRDGAPVASELPFNINFLLPTSGGPK
jgi:protein TonB